MKNIEQKYGLEIYRIIMKAFKKNAQYQVEDIFPKISTSTFFDSTSELGKQKFKQNVIEIYDEVNKITEKHLQLNYIPGFEFEKFPRFTDVWITIIHSLEELEGKEHPAVILPFKKQ
ncbi:hypothetical protein [Bacillus bombysepticus]|uniref:hypothetical protein n=1 Tax=Bacillus bombysepticus TaxID=658666 RepID=UPI0030186033